MNVKIAVCGCGHWGKNHVRNHAELGSLAAVFDPDTAIAKKYASEYNVLSLSFDEILNSEDIDGVVLASPAHLHATMAIQALQAGKHVFVEKPLALTVDDAQSILQEAKRADRYVMVGHLLQYHAAFIKLKELVGKDNVLGKLRFINATRVSTGKIRTEENALWSFAPHDISMILSLIGEDPETVNANGKAVLQEYIEDIVHVDMQFASGIYAHVTSSWLYPDKEHKMIICGENGYLIFDDREPFEKKIKLIRHDIKMQDGYPSLTKDEDGEYIAVEPSEPLKAECLHFLQSIEYDTEPQTDGDEGLRVLSVLEKATEALRG